nr:hypothetical protein BaRGS_003131 [Batillaria attramentaria]KAG5703842.1 hypothetical protein BaRGS_031476 [Batillaria attramentaria]
MPTAIRTTGYTTPYEDLSALDKFLLLSDEKREMANSIQKPLGFAFAAVAIPLALCNVIVFSQKDMRSASGTYVIALNLGQAFYILTSTVEKAWQEIVEIPLSQFSYCVFSSYFAAFAACVLAVYAMTIILHLYSVTRFRLVVMTYPPFGKICIPVKTDIYLSYPELSEGLVQLKDVPNLQVLSLADNPLVLTPQTDISPLNFSVFGQFRQLRFLNLSNSGIDRRSESLKLQNGAL